LRRLERVWRTTGAVEDETAYLLAQERDGVLAHSQLITAAYLSSPAARGCFRDGLYDLTGKMNDHIVGICPCGDCLWDEGEIAWINNLVGRHAENLPFPGIDGPHARQEMLIRMGRALSNAVWDKLYTPEEPYGAFVRSDMAAERFLEERTEEARAACREQWDDPDWGCPDWGHAAHYYIVANPAGHTGNIHVWFNETAELLRGLCPECDFQEGEEVVEPEQESRCLRCEGPFPHWEDLLLSRKVVEDALIPWVLGRL